MKKSVLYMYLVNQQVNDKERIKAAYENEALN